MKWIVTLFLISIGYSQSQFGIGLGYGKGGVSFNMGGVGKYSDSSKRKLFSLIGGNIFSGRRDKDIYDCSPNLLDEDENRGKIKEDYWLVGGPVFKIKYNTQIYLGGGLNVYSEYLKMYDDTEIFGNEDDNTSSKSPIFVTEISASPTFIIGFSAYQIGIYYNTFPNNISLVYWFK